MANDAPQIEPYEVVNLVERYVDQELGNAAKFDNCTPLDESGVWSLHRLAAKVYALGYEAGGVATEMRHRARDSRKREESADV